MCRTESWHDFSWLIQSQCSIDCHRKDLLKLEKAAACTPTAPVRCSAYGVHGPGIPFPSSASQVPHGDFSFPPQMPHSHDSLPLLQECWQCLHWSQSSSPAAGWRCRLSCVIIIPVTHKGLPLQILDCYGY